MPGPGTYYESINLIPGGIAEGAAKKKGFSMSGRTRIGTTNDENPGPGTHEVISSFSKTQGVGRNGTGFLFSIKGKYYRPDSEATPGPIYNVIPNASHKGGVAFGRRVRLHGTNDGPGPAAYDPKQIQKKFGMTFGSRLPHSSSTYLGSAQAKSVILKGHGGD